MESCYTRITNYEMITRPLGGWPSFDDFEVVSMLLERSHDGEEPWPVLTAQFVGFRPDVGPESPDRNNCLLTLQFGGVEDVKLEGFNHQNAINGFEAVHKWSERLNREMFSVKIIQGFGVGATFKCSEIEVVSVNPTAPRKP
jgi:hypothetical protein